MSFALKESSEIVEKDQATVTADGQPLAMVPDGVTFRETPTHIDDRGSVFEMYDPRWQWHSDPLVYSYCYTIRPNKVKGWGMHKKHEDRYFTLLGEMMVVMYDDRPESPTYELLSKVVLSEYNRRLMNIPAGVWHANQNLGQSDVVVVNFPTIPYDHSDPDKYRLALDTDRIPYKFTNVEGW